jgi:NAD(P)-dependent dehydrogenase (short-subunit alcohol dehydrogenase family)
MNVPGEKRVVITGANEGIGYHLLTSLIRDGHRVAGLDVDGKHVESLRESHPMRVRFFECDVTRYDDVETTVGEIRDRWGRLDVLVNNASIFNFASFEDQRLTDTRREFEVNYFGYVRTIRAVLPHMRKRNEGIIHDVSSGAGLVGHPDSLLNDPADVGRKLAGKIESTDRDITADWQTKVGLYLSQRLPYLVERGTERFVSAGD